MSLTARTKKAKLEELKIQHQELQNDLSELVSYLDAFSAFLPVGVCVVSPVGVIIDVNDALCSLTGFRDVELVGKYLEDMFLEKEAFQEIIKKVSKKEEIKGKELTLISKEGRKIPVSFSAKAREDKEGHFISFFVAILDITESKRFQERLKEKVEIATKKLKDRIAELEKLHRLTVGRELRMIELKKEIEKLKKEKRSSKKSN